MRYEVPSEYRLDAERAAVIDAASRTFVNVVLHAQSAVIEAACRDLAALGYTPADLRLVHHPALGRLSLIVIQVRGRDVVEIETSFQGQDMAIKVRTNVLAWPPPIDPIAPQVSRVASGA